MTSDLELDALLGKTINGKYRVEGLIGRGGMGSVYEATHLAIGKHVALKFLYRDAARDLDAVTRFQREAEAASAVESAHIVQIFDSGTTDDGLPFLVMELLRGEDLRSRMRRESRLEVPEVIHVGTQVCRALKRAHEAGIVHRDLKPDNVFLCHRDDDDGFVKLVDFGISKVSRKTVTVDTLTRRGMVLGTAFYMAPEQAQAARDVDGRADIFSLGSILFEALAGRPPHAGTVYEAILIDICTKDAPDVREFAPEVPASLADVIARSLERDREARFQSAQDLYEALVNAAPDSLRGSLSRSFPARHLTKAQRAALMPVPVSATPGSGSAKAPPHSPLPTVDGTVGSLRPATRISRSRLALFALGVTATAMVATLLLLAQSPNPSASTPANSQARPNPVVGRAVRGTAHSGSGVIPPAAGGLSSTSAPGVPGPLADGGHGESPGAPPSGPAAPAVRPAAVALSPTHLVSGVIPGIASAAGLNGSPRAAAPSPSGRPSKAPAGIGKTLQLATEP